MKASCEQLAAFVDGELSAQEAEAFQQHLAGCADCQAGLEDQMQASLAVSSAGEAKRERRGAFKPLWDRPRVRMMALSTGVAAILGILVMGSWKSSRQPLEDPLLLARAETRPMEGRLGYPGADRYRKLGTMRGDPQHGTGLDLRVLAELQDRGDLRGVATAYLLSGDPERAEAYLDQVPRSPDVDSDRALAALGRGDLERALGLLDGAVQAAPDLLRAHWNRGVVLRAMSLQLAAAAEFQHVAEKGEPGWGDEARQLAEGLRSGAEARRKSWTDMKAAGMALALEGKPIPPAMVARNPGMVRLYLYHAIRAAQSREQVLALLPLAESLDQVFRSRASSEYVQSVARADFARRGPLVETYRALLSEQTLSGTEADAYLDRLRRSGEKDLLLGALMMLRAERAHLAQLEKLVQESGDAAWYRAPLVKAQVAEDLKRGDASQAERRVLDAIDECRRANLEQRCVSLLEELSDLYNKLDRRREAMGPAREALEVARRTDDWFHEDLLVSDLMTAARLSHEPALARAYLDEHLQREPESCERRAEYHYARALIALEALDAASARREVQAARACEAPPTLFEAAVYGDLLRFGASADEVARAEDRIRTLRADTSLTPGERLFLEHVSGRILIERDRAAGQRMLRDVIASADRTRRSDIEARKAWSYSHQVLVLDAGRAGEFDPAISLLSAELERAAPPKCLLAVAGQDERILFVARGPQGELKGEYLGQLTRPPREEVPAVPASILEVLASCDSVRVLAEPILQGRPGLLPTDRAWSYLVPRAAEPKAPAVTPPEKHVVVSDVEPPASLKLPHLLPWSRAPRPGEVHLRGPSATPSTVLAELTDATEVEFHAHGLIRSGFSDASFLALSPEPGGRYALTAGDLQGRSLKAAPLVLLAACHANGGALRYYAVWSLPAAFIQAGARAVVAPTDQVPDVEVGAVFQELLDRVDSGASPAQALRDIRVAWLQKGAGRWVSDLVVFE